MDFPFEIYSESVEYTEELGKMLAGFISEDDALPRFVAMYGDLGVGKTVFTQGFADGLGVREQVNSPTFTILQIYESGRLPLYHFDVYRLGSGDELLDTGAEELLDGDGACVIEWADIVADVLPADSLIVSLNYGGSENERTAEIY
jgi:tRNA threonylcarbamoyladenosine biosynthesis protein TsaE